MEVLYRHLSCPVNKGKTRLSCGKLSSGPVPYHNNSLGIGEPCQTLSAIPPGTPFTFYHTPTSSAVLAKSPASCHTPTPLWPCHAHSLLLVTSPHLPWSCHDYMPYRVSHIRLLATAPMHFISVFFQIPNPKTHHD